MTHFIVHIEKQEPNNNPKSIKNSMKTLCGYPPISAMSLAAPVPVSKFALISRIALFIMSVLPLSCNILFDKIADTVLLDTFILCNMFKKTPIIFIDKSSMIEIDPIRIRLTIKAALLCLYTDNSFKDINNKKHAIGPRDPNNRIITKLKIDKNMYSNLFLLFSIKISFANTHKQKSIWYPAGIEYAASPQIVFTFLIFIIIYKDMIIKFNDAIFLRLKYNN